MRIFIYILLLIVLGNQTIAQNQADIDRLKTHVYVLASDSLAGRGTGTVGQKKAAAYIAHQFKETGLIPLGDNYYDYFELVKGHKQRATLNVDGNLVFTPWHFYYRSNYNHKQRDLDSLVFVAYGTSEDLRHVRIEEQSLVLLANNPEDAYRKIKRIQEAFETRNFFVILKGRSDKVDLAWRKEFESTKTSLRSVYKGEQDFAIQEPWVTLEGLDSVNVFYCFENVLEKVLGKNDVELFDLAKRVGNGDFSSQIPAKAMQCSMNYFDTVEVTQTENITGFIKGKDTTRTIVVSAHYDHLGIIDGEIHYGADDNASGTAALLEIARLIRTEGVPPCNVQFIAFSAEELGLLGSKEYVEHPYFPLSTISVNINMDMLGRWDQKHSNNKDFVYLLQAGGCEVDWYKLGKKQARGLPLKVSKNPGSHEKKLFTYGSDHYSFYQKDVPVVVVFTGLHEDYHTPRDVPEKINFKNLGQITSLVSRMIMAE